MGRDNNNNNEKEGGRKEWWKQRKKERKKKNMRKKGKQWAINAKIENDGIKGIENMEAERFTLCAQGKSL